MVYQLTKFHVQRVDMVINPPWNLPFLGAKGLTSPEQTATGKGISNPFMAVMVCQKPYGIQLTNVSSTETLKNSCCKDKKRRLEVLQIKNNLKNSIYNILRKLKVFKVKIKNVLKELEVHKLAENYEARPNNSFPPRAYEADSDRAVELESPVTCDEIHKAVWACRENKSPGPDGFTFEFFRKFWVDIGPDFCAAVVWFFDHCSFARGCNSAFIALIPKVPGPKFVNDFCPISLIGCLYKVITKILAMHLSMVISDLISDVQTAFLPKRQILDGPFIINKLLSWCKCKKKQAKVFKVDFAKAYDSIRWDYLDEVLHALFGLNGVLRSCPTSEFDFHCGLEARRSFGSVPFILVGISSLVFTRVV
ncbi:RNA-directed DNA polymerase, eukaryota [Tanacetum coccineum]